MAIDGTRIIDSDIGYDIYNAVVERYKNGENIEIIIEDILAEADNFSINELYTEIYWTALALSLWKIGHLKEDIKNKALEIIKGGASKFWLEYIDEKAQKSRQKHLEKLELQLHSENPKPLKPYKQRKTPLMPLFERGDVLAIKIEQEYGACFVFSVEQTPRKIEYHLICTKLLQDSLPALDDILHSKIATKRSSLGIETDCWFSHKDLKEIYSSFTKVGKVEFEDECKLWLLSPAKNLEDVYNQIIRDAKIWKFYLSDVSKIIRNIVEC